MLPLLTPPAGDGRTPEEYTYDMQQSGQYYEPAATTPIIVTDTPDRCCIDIAVSAVRVEHWQSDEGGATYTDFEIGKGWDQVRLGTYGGEKPGVHLVIARECLNERANQIITLADVRQLRDNLTALLDDPRLLAVMA